MLIDALPKRFPSHPKGTALAVLDHVDRPWGYSIQTPHVTGPQIGTFRDTIGHVLTGDPVGLAMSKAFGARYSAWSTALVSTTSPFANEQVEDRDLVMPWCERNDAQNYVVLGDPAVGVRVADP